MRISFLCSDHTHPVNEYLENWINQNKYQYDIELVRKKSELTGGDILFLVSCAEVISKESRSIYKASLVIHASDLPFGRGWSPHIWQILEGNECITLSLLEAEDMVDSGKIWKKIKIRIPRHAIWNEINELIFDAEIKLIDFAVNNFESVVPEPQCTNLEPTYWPRRTPEDSKIDPSISIECLFDKIRVCDPSRFPAFFELKGKKYTIYLEKKND